MRIFSGIQPTGRKHLGNYIGAFVPYVEGQERGEGIYCIVDLHATTVAYEPEVLRSGVYDLAALLLEQSLAEIECNPVLVGAPGEGATAVDATIRLRGEGE